jgi:hypothetical protein
MSDTSSSAKKYTVAFGLGALASGILFAWATNAMPKMMSKIMQNMIARMQEEGCDPKEM